MARDTKAQAVRIQERNAKVKEDYARLYKKGLRHDVIVPQLSVAYYLSPRTIEAIVWGICGYAPKKEI